MFLKLRVRWIGDETDVWTEDAPYPTSSFVTRRPLNPGGATLGAYVAKNWGMGPMLVNFIDDDDAP